MSDENEDRDGGQTYGIWWAQSASADQVKRVAAMDPDVVLMAVEDHLGHGAAVVRAALDEDPDGDRLDRSDHEEFWESVLTDEDVGAARYPSREMVAGFIEGVQDGGAYEQSMISADDPRERGPERL